MNNDLLKTIREAAMEKFASEAEVDAFMEGFEKIALSPDQAALITKGLLTGVGTIGAGLAGAAIAKGLFTVGGAISNNVLHSKFETSLNYVMQNNRVVRGADPVKAKQYAQTIFNFAPHVASDPNLLSSILANAVQGEGIDPMTIKTLTELEGRYKDNASHGPISGIRA